MQAERSISRQGRHAPDRLMAVEEERALVARCPELEIGEGCPICGSWQVPSPVCAECGWADAR